MTPEPSAEGGTTTAVVTPPGPSPTSGEAGAAARGPDEGAQDPAQGDTTAPRRTEETPPDAPAKATTSAPDLTAAHAGAATTTGTSPAAVVTAPSTEPGTKATVPGAEPVPSGDQAGAHAHRLHRRRPWRWIVTVVLLVLLLGGAGYAGVYLYQTSQAWEERAEEYLRASQGLGAELATSETALAGARSELEAVRAQLATAQTRIVELADEKAQLGDDREVQRQLVDYQQRISEAAGQVALALDQCVQGQNQLIGYMENAAQYDPAELEQFGTDVQALCQAATDANAALQRELAP